jgi:hypothetical protein
MTRNMDQLIDGATGNGEKKIHQEIKGQCHRFMITVHETSYVIGIRTYSTGHKKMFKCPFNF